jgi:hypothetical protein
MQQTSEAVVLQFPTKEAPGHDAWLDDDDYSYWKEMGEKSFSELFADLLILLIGVAALAVLILITSASLWASLWLSISMHGMWTNT